MKNKGFTLIELLTVIVVISIVMTIAYAVIRNNILVSKKETFKTSVNNVLEAAKEYVTVNFDENDFPVGGISVTDLDLKRSDIKSGMIGKDSEGIIKADNISSDSFCANGSKNELVIKEGSCDKYDETAPTIEVSTKKVGMNSITVLVKMNDSQSGLKELEYCNGSNCKKIELDNEKTEVREFVKFDNLKPNETYNFNFKVITNNKNTSYNNSSTSISATTIAIEKPTFKVSSSVYALKKIVEISYPEIEGYRFKYKVNEGELVETNKKKVEVEVNSASTIYAYVYQGDTAVTSDFLSIAGIDNIVPSSSLKGVTTIPSNIEDYNGYMKSITLEIEASDNESGLAMRAYSYDKGETWERSNKHTYTSAGEYEIYVRDRLGNINKKFCDPSKSYIGGSCICDDNVCKFIFDKVDGEAPTCIITGESTTWTRGNRTIYAECNDNDGSGCIQSTYSKTYSTTTKTANVSFEVSDKVGNKRTCSKTANIYIDKTAPTCGSFTGESTIWTSENRTIGLTCQDGHSGCVQSSYSKTFSDSIKIGSWATTISDKVGNTKECLNDNLNIYIDKVVPTIQLSKTEVAGQTSSYDIYSATFGLSGEKSFNCNPETITSATDVTCTAVSNAGLSATRTDNIGYVNPVYTVYFKKGKEPHGCSNLFSGPSFTSKKVTYGQPYGNLPTVTGAYYDYLYCSASWGPCSYDSSQTCKTAHYNVYTPNGWIDENGQKVTKDTIYNIQGDTTLTSTYTCSSNHVQEVNQSYCRASC